MALRLRRYAPWPVAEPPPPPPPPPPPLPPLPQAAQPAILTLDNNSLVLAIRVAGEPRAEIAELASLPALPAPQAQLQPPQPQSLASAEASALSAQSSLLRVQAALAVAEESIKRSMVRSMMTVVAITLYFVVVFALAATSPSALGLDDSGGAAAIGSSLVIGLLAGEILAGAAGLAALRFRVADGLGAYTIAQLCLTMASLRTIYFSWAFVILRSLALVSSLHMRLLFTARLLLESEGARSISAEAIARNMLATGTRLGTRELQREITSRVADLMAANDAVERARARVGPAVSGELAAAAGMRPAAGGAEGNAAAAEDDPDAAFDALVKWQERWVQVRSSGGARG
jgi:hypothetical protein